MADKETIKTIGKERALREQAAELFQSVTENLKCGLYQGIQAAIRDIGEEPSE